jgi:hypothetical protein
MMKSFSFFSPLLSSLFIIGLLTTSSVLAMGDDRDLFKVVSPVRSEQEANAARGAPINHAAAVAAAAVVDNGGAAVHAAAAQAQAEFIDFETKHTDTTGADALAKARREEHDPRYWIWANVRSPEARQRNEDARRRCEEARQTLEELAAPRPVVNHGAVAAAAAMDDGRAAAQPAPRAASQARRKD